MKTIQYENLKDTTGKYTSLAICDCVFEAIMNDEYITGILGGKPATANDQSAYIRVQWWDRALTIINDYHEQGFPFYRLSKSKVKI